MRYFVEAVADAFGARARVAAADRTQVTESLGAAQDTAIGCDELGEATATAPNNDEPTGTYLHLQASQRRKRKRLLAAPSAALDAALAGDLSQLREP